MPFNLSFLVGTAELEATMALNTFGPERFLLNWCCMCKSAEKIVNRLLPHCRKGNVDCSLSRSSSSHARVGDISPSILRSRGFSKDGVQTGHASRGSRGSILLRMMR